MAKTEILSKLNVGSGIDTTELIKALVDADTAATKENLDNLEEKANNQISTFALLKNNLKSFKDIVLDIQSQQEYGFTGNTSDATVATLTASGSKAGSTIDSSIVVNTLASSHTLTGPLIHLQQQLLVQEICRLVLERGLLTPPQEEVKVLQLTV